MLSVVVLHITEYFCNTLVYLFFICVMLLQRRLKKKRLWLLSQWWFKELIFIKLDSKWDLCIACYYKNISRVRFWVSYMLLVIPPNYEQSCWFLYYTFISWIHIKWKILNFMYYYLPLFFPDDQCLSTFLCKNLKNIMNRLDNVLWKKLNSFLNTVLIFSLKTLKIS